MVARVFLVRPAFDRVQEIREEVNRRNPLMSDWKKRPLGLSTVSKALKTLEEDLIIARGEGIRLLQGDTLLEKLRLNYGAPAIKEVVRLRIAGDGATVLQVFQEQARAAEIPFVATGVSSVRQYAVMQRGEMVSIYCPRLSPIVERLPGNRADRFPNLEVLETEDERVYFDARKEQDFCWASPVQVYLELMAGDKRDQETAEQVKLFIMNTVGRGRQ